MNVVWCTRAMRGFGETVAEALGWPLFVDCPVLDADVVYIIGMYDPPHYNYTLDMTKGAKRRIIHWCGSDVYGLVAPDFLPEAVHVAESQGLADMLLIKGVETTTITFPLRFMPEVTPLPDEDMVGVYLGSTPLRYGESTVRALAEMMPDVKFHTYPHGTYGIEQMHDVVAKTKVYLRLVFPDGSATSAREYMCAGRRAITTVDVPYAKVVVPDDLTGITRALRAALKHSEPDYEAAAFHHAFNQPERFREEVEALL